MDNLQQDTHPIIPSQPAWLDISALRRTFMHSLNAVAELPEEVDPVFVHQAQYTRTIFRAIEEFQMADPIEAEASELPTISEIIQRVADAMCVSMDRLKSPKRSARVAICRQTAMYLCRKLHPKVSFPRIGECFGRDHTTVMHGVKLIQQRMSKNVAYRLYIERLERQVTRSTNQNGTNGGNSAAD